MKPTLLTKNFLFTILLSLAFSTTTSAQDDIPSEETHPTVRIGCHLQNNVYRSLLIGFMQNGSESYDSLDAYNVFNLSNDIYFLAGNTELMIQAVGPFATSTGCYPIGIESTIDGDITFNFMETTNLPTTQDVYIYDNLLNIYTNIKLGTYTAFVAAGTQNTRFSLRFSNTSLSTGTSNVATKEIMIINSNTNHSLQINNNSSEVSLLNFALYNTAGQKVSEMNTINNQQLSIDTNNFSKGVYVVNIQTTNGFVNKKIVIQ